MAKILQLEVDTTRNEITDFAGQTYREISMVAGDEVLIAAHFTEVTLDGLSQQDTDLSGALALRASIGRNRQTDTTVLAFEDVFNNADLPTFEDLATGRVSWLLNLDAAAFESALGTNESIEVFLEFTTLTVGDSPQTLAQIGVILFAQIDDGAVGVPAPATSYITSTVAVATFVALIDYLVPVTIAIDTLLVSIKGLKVLLVDTSGGPVLITLPKSDTSDAKFSPLIINIGTGVVSVAPDATDPDTINDLAGTQTITTQFGSLRMFNDPANDNWLAPTFVVP